MKYLIGIALFGGGVFVGVQLTKWYATKKVTSEGDAFIGKVFGSGYAGQVATGVFHGALDQVLN